MEGRDRGDLNRFVLPFKCTNSFGAGSEKLPVVLNIILQDGISCLPSCTVLQQLVCCNSQYERETLLALYDER